MTAAGGALGSQGTERPQSPGWPYLYAVTITVVPVGAQP
jgi:hypothetical protein